MWLFGCIAVVGGVYGAWDFAGAHEARDPLSRATLASLFVLFAVFGVCCIIAALKFRTVLFADRIEVCEFVKTRVFARQQLLGRRFIRGHNSPGTYLLVPRGKQRPLKLARVFRMDEPLRQWIESLPDLDAKDLRASEEEILASPEGSTNRMERADRLAAARRLATLLMFVSAGAGALGWLYPRPYWLIMFTLVFLPWVAVVITARSEGLFRIDEKKNDAHPNVAVAFIMPGFILALRAVTDFHLLDWKPALLLTIFVALALWLAAAASDASLRQNRVLLSLTLLLASAYGFGASTEANCLLDRSKAAVYPTRIIAKYVESGRHTSYNLRLAGWQNTMEDEKAEVPFSFYSLVKEGETVCVSVRAGALKIRWYVVRRCR